MTLNSRYIPPIHNREPVTGDLIAGVDEESVVIECLCLTLNESQNILPNDNNYVKSIFLSLLVSPCSRWTSDAICLSKYTLMFNRLY